MIIKPKAAESIMRHRGLGSATALLLVLLTGALQAAEEIGTVIRAVDGDTLVVRIDDHEEKVRLIGVDTPESVHPQKPVEFFSKEASEFTRQLVEGKRVVLRDELGGQDRDRYGRLLRYVFLEDGTHVNAEIIRQGYGHAYTKYPFSRMEEFRGYERQAREQGLGLWGGVDATARPDQARAPTADHYVGSAKSNKYHRPDCRWAQKIGPANLLTFDSPEDAQSRSYVPCKVCTPPTVSGVQQAPSVAAPDQDAQTVYVTRTGSKYHRAGCRYLSKSMIPMKLKNAAKRYAPCRICQPPSPK